MNQLERLKLLSGQNLSQDKLNKMTQDLKKINEEYAAALDAIRRGKQIDEGLFTSLSAALQTAAQLGQQGAKKVADTAKNVGANIKNLYLDNKAQAELKVLVDELKGMISQFDKLAMKVPTIMQRDPEVAKEMQYFQRVFSAMINTIASRMAVQEGITDLDEIEVMLKELLATEAPENTKK